MDWPRQEWLLRDCRRRRFKPQDRHFGPLRVEPDMPVFLAIARAFTDEAWPCAGCGLEPVAGRPNWPKHVLPPSWGGLDEPDNLLPLCRECMRTAQQIDIALMEEWADALNRGEDTPVPLCALMWTA